jgi:hypothetical protein
MGAAPSSVLLREVPSVRPPFDCVICKNLLAAASSYLLFGVSRVTATLLLAI